MTVEAEIARLLRGHGVDGGRKRTRTESYACARRTIGEDDRLAGLKDADCRKKKMLENPIEFD